MCEWHRAAWAALGVWMSVVAPAMAQVAETPATKPAGGGYYVEFRAAEMGLYGHSYIAYGRLGPGGRVASTQYADFHPKGDTLGLAVGHVVPVAAGMEPGKDVLALPLTTRFRKTITAAQYKTLTAAVADAKSKLHVWSALAYNCNSFVGDMAQAIGMKSPSSLLFANAFVPTLRDLNETPAETATRAAATSRPAASPSRAPKRLQSAQRPPTS